MAWKSKPRGTRTIDRFAEALAETGDVYATALLAKIRIELGGQAR